MTLSDIIALLMLICIAAGVLAAVIFIIREWNKP
jgi:hypothetical protein